jgi:signal peptidase I
MHRGLLTVDVEKRRYPIVAFLLSLLLPGLGQVYNGRPIRGLIFSATWLAVVVISGLVGVCYTFSGLAPLALANFVWFVVVATDAALLSRKFRGIRLGWHNRWYSYVGFALMFAPVSYCFLVPPVSILGVRGFWAPSAAMEPTLKVGDHFMARVQPYKSEKPRRRDIVIFPFPEDRSKTFVKRLIGFGGENFEIRNKQVFIDGKPIEEPYKQHIDPRILPGKAVPRDNFGPITIPNGSVFVMGDNRDFSHDSRFWGPVSVGDLEAKGLFIYWANDLSRMGTRLE